MITSTLRFRFLLPLALMSNLTLREQNARGRTQRCEVAGLPKVPARRHSMLQFARDGSTETAQDPTKHGARARRSPATAPPSRS